MIDNPTFVSGFLLSSLYGVAFHFWKGGNFFQLLFYLILAWLGFLFGQWFASQIGWSFWKIGSLQAGLASIFSLGFLFIGYWLSGVNKNRIKKV